MSHTNEGHKYDWSEISKGLRTDAVVSSTSNLRNHYDVTVIGSGFCGLVAARNLSLNRDIRLLLLEARDRIGGRTWTAKEWGEDLEMGDTSLHWHQPHVYAEMHRHGLERHLKTLAATTDTKYMLYKPEGSSVQRIDDPWQKYDHLSCQDRLNQLELPQHDKDLFVSQPNSFGSCIAQDLAWTDALRWYAVCGYGLATMYDAVGGFKLGGGGTTNMCRDILAEYRGNRIFSKVVNAIKQTKDSKMVVIACADGSSYNAPGKQNAIQDGHINFGEKYIASLDAVKGNWFANTSDFKDSCFFFGMKDHNGTQSANRAGTYAMMFGQSSKLQDSTNSDEIIAEFKKLQPSGNVRGYASHTWSKDPYAKGAWFAASPGWATKNLKALQEPHGRVFMASADWAQGWRGFIDGAIEQGTRAAAITKLALEQENGTVDAKL
ncbi:hypothetical protein J3E73DRAFT_178756 [Bipolaris maydis]|nr:hypothetical protein J3E73DRAFT_178756 [Bipolaris maydis]